MLDEYTDVLTVDDACEALKIGHNSIYVLLNSGQLKGYRCGRIWKIPKLAVQQYILDNANLKY
jgi:excisionase family DNA binding protein